MKLMCLNPTTTLMFGKIYNGDLLRKENNLFTGVSTISDATHFRVINSEGKAVTCDINRFG